VTAGGEIRVRVVRLPGAADLPLPAPATRGAAGLDLHAALDAELVLRPGARVRVPTGLCVAIPDGFEGQVRPRSGLAFEHGLTLPNAPGTIDSDYRGELLVILLNAGREPVTIRRGDRIAQLVIAPVARAQWEEVESLPASERGAGGFGSTGRGQGRDEEAG
jgi:deoxyuridine 5'-triphosphate nucleotidohydrolase